MAQESTGTGTRKAGNIIDELLLNFQLAWRLMGDSRVSMLYKVLIPLAGVVYFISPIDLLPDFIPVLGQLDEVAIILLLIRLFISLAPPEIVAEYKAGMGRATGRRYASAGATDTGAGSARPQSDDVVDADYRVVNE